MIYDKINLLNVSFILLIIIIFILSYTLMKFKKENKELKNEIKSLETKKSNNLNNLNTSEMKELKTFLDEIIKDKFNYYLLNNILPKYIAGEKISKKEFKELKELFYIDISLLLSKNTKAKYLKYFNKDGLKAYINEKFSFYVNKVDRNFFDESTIDKKLYDSILK